MLTIAFACVDDDEVSNMSMSAFFNSLWSLHGNAPFSLSVAKKLPMHLIPRQLKRYAKPKAPSRSMILVTTFDPNFCYGVNCPDGKEKDRLVFSMYTDEMFNALWIACVLDVQKLPVMPRVHTTSNRRLIPRYGDRSQWSPDLGPSSMPI